MTPAELEGGEITTDQLAGLWLAVDEYRTVANQVEKILNDELGRRLENQGGGTIEVGDWLVFRGYRSKSEKCTDPDGFWDWMRAKALQVEDPIEFVSRLVNPNSLRIGSLPPAVRETFYEKTIPPKAEKQAVAAPIEKVEEARIKRERHT